MIKLRLKEFLTANNLSTYRLEREVSGVSRTSLYKLTAGDTDGIRFPTLDAIIAALTKLTGKPVTPNDLLEVIEEPTPVLQTLKPGEVAEDRLKITPAQGKFAPKFPTLKSVDGSSVSETVIKQREERTLATSGIK
jgi:DNA-binding Xre family transcriptional regulator